MQRVADWMPAPIPENNVQTYESFGRAVLGIEPRTSRTRSENHATRPNSQSRWRRPAPQHHQSPEFELGLFWELSPGPLAPRARIIPLDQTAIDCDEVMESKTNGIDGQQPTGTTPPNDPGKTRTCNLWFRGPTPYPLGHRTAR